MGSVLTAWRHAGGGLRTPLPQDQALRLAKTMGAGLMVDGSVVASGQRLTISASVIRSADGLIRRAPPVSGSADSLDALTNRVIVGIMAAAGGEARLDERSRTTASPAAMRAYLEGLAAWRRGQIEPATIAYERALDLDSSFAQAAFQRLLIAIWIQDSTVQTRWGPLAWSFRDRLSRPDRAVLVSFLGPRFPDRTLSAEWLAAADRATREAPESPEAWYQYGDLLFHGGGAREADPLTHALTLFERSLGLDSQETVLEHLVEGALLNGDSALLRRLPIAPIMDGYTTLAWYAASQSGDTRTLNALRQREPRWTGFLPFGGLYGASRATIDEMMSILVTRRHENRGGFHQVLLAQGRPAAAQAFVLTTAPDPGPNRDRSIVEAAAWADGDTAAAVAAVARLAARPARTPIEASAMGCTLAQWAFARGQRVEADEAVVRIAAPGCARMITLMKAAQSGAPELAFLLPETDSLVRESVFNAQMNGFEGIVLARLWAARGDRQRALSAIRLRVEGNIIQAGLYGSVRDEGPFALAAGDTTGAIRAFRRYLRMRADPEPALIPQRDSVVETLARIQRRAPTP
jgi:hypothetical protein